MGNSVSMEAVTESFAISACSMVKFKLLSPPSAF